MAQALPDARIYAHRGASALLPEHTLPAYAQAIADGAHYIELDLVPSADGVLVVRHENELSASTDVAEHRQFRDRRTTKVIDGVSVQGWFTEDFTWEELQQLRARERLPELRGTAFDGQFKLARLEEVIALVVSQVARSGRGVGLAPELKHPAYFRSLGLALEPRVLQVLAADPYTRVAPIVLQSFEADSLKQLRQQVPRGGNIALLQLVDSDQGQLLSPAKVGGNWGDLRHHAESSNDLLLRATASVNGEVAARVRFADEQPPGLRQNQRLSVRILLDSRQDVVMVERGPFLEQDGGRFAWVVDGRSASRRPIQAGASSLGYVEIVSGLEEGERIVVSGSDQFGDAQRVAIN